MEPSHPWPMCREHGGTVVLQVLYRCHQKFVSYCCPVLMSHFRLAFLLRKQSSSSGSISLFSVLLMLTPS